MAEILYVGILLIYFGLFIACLVMASFAFLFFIGWTQYHWERKGMYFRRFIRQITSN